MKKHTNKGRGRKLHKPRGFRECRVRCELRADWDKPRKPRKVSVLRETLSNPEMRAKFDALPKHKQERLNQKHRDSWANIIARAKPFWTYIFNDATPANENSYLEHVRTKGREFLERHPELLGDQ